MYIIYSGCFKVRQTRNKAHPVISLKAFFDMFDSKPAMQWQRTEHSITSLLIKLDQNGEAVITVASGKWSTHIYRLGNEERGY